MHIGGNEVKAGWKLLDIQDSAGVDYVGDIRNLWVFEDESCDEIYASHVLEHVELPEVLTTLQGVRRILKTGGKFYISVPDMNVLCHAFLSPQATLEIRFQIMRMIFGGQVDANDFHHFGWNEELLGKYLQDAGFSSMQKVTGFGLFDDTSNYRPYGIPISLNIIAFK